MQRMQRQELHDEWWGRATTLRDSLAAGAQLQSVDIPVVLPMDHGEYPVGWLTGAVLSYDRYLGAEVTLTSAGHVSIGNPAFVVGAAVGAAAQRSRMRRTATRYAAPQWRSWPLRHATITTHRIWCEVRDHNVYRWLNFDYAATTKITLHGWAAHFHFINSAPLALSGPAGPGCAALASYGHPEHQVHQLS